MFRTAFEERWHNLGLQFVFSGVQLVLAGINLSTNQKQLELFEELLRQAIDGLILLVERQNGEMRYLRSHSWNELIEMERAYEYLKPALPEDPDEAKSRLEEMHKISKQLVAGESLSPDEKKKLHDFCREAMKMLEQERFQLVQGTPGIFSLD